MLVRGIIRATAFKVITDVTVVVVLFYIPVFIYIIINYIAYTINNNMHIKLNIKLKACHIY